METYGNSNETGGSSFEGERQNLKHKARDTADRARNQVRSFADSGRNEIASQLSEISRALRSTGDKLRDEEGGERASRFTDMLADRVDRASHFLEEHDADELLDRVENVARKSPGIFLGGCVAVGFALGRFLKASPSSSGDQEQLPLGVTDSEESRGETVYEYEGRSTGEELSGGGISGEESETSGYGAGTSGGYEAGSTGGMGGFQGGFESDEERKRREAKAAEREVSSSNKVTEVIEVESSGPGYVQPVTTTKTDGESGER